MAATIGAAFSESKNNKDIDRHIIIAHDFEAAKQLKDAITEVTNYLEKWALIVVI